MASIGVKQYPAYKDSGIEWIGEIPEHWNAVRLKRATQFLYGDSLSNENRIEGEVPVYGSNGITGYHNQAITNIPCIVIGRKGSFGKINYSEVPCFPIDTTYFIDDTATDNDIRWLYFALQTLNLDSISKDSAVPGLSREDAYDRITLLPSAAEQQAIADYLDKKTALIDELIGKKRRQIELLKEQRQAVINQVVTKGLDPNVEMKDSGIEWLGEIPKHWQAMKITYACSKINDGTHFSPESDFTGERLYITAKNIKEDGVQVSNATYITEEAHRIIYQRCPVVKGDVLYIKDGATAGIATVNQLDEEFSLLSSVALIRPVEETLLAKFLAYQLNDANFKSCILNNLVGGAMTRFTVEIIKRFRLVVPPVAEQNIIIKYLDNITKEVAFTVSKAEQQIQLLQEYRTALISEAVTGKIDVREAG